MLTRGKNKQPRKTKGRQVKKLRREMFCANRDLPVEDGDAHVGVMAAVGASRYAKCIPLISTLTKRKKTRMKYHLHSPT